MGFSGWEGGCIGSQGSLPLWVVVVFFFGGGAVLVVKAKGHYPCGFPGGCIGSQGSLLQWVSRGLYW